MSESIDIRSSDDVKMSVSKEVLDMWLTVSNMLKSYISKDDSEESGPCIEEIPISGVTGSVLRKIVNYCEDYLKDPNNETWREEFFRNTHGAESVENVKTYHRELVDIINAADYLEIKPLIEDIGKIMAATIRGKSPQSIREEWGFPDDLTKEEKERILDENRWAFDL